mmetsp:Transcript_1936/g.3496  ORF Transcript_1936/g.3496 Transcript_1936/m.3496 type:complete len:91 (-) Transcript_1936:31-303(-)
MSIIHFSEEITTPFFASPFCASFSCERTFESHHTVKCYPANRKYVSLMRLSDVTASGSRMGLRFTPLLLPSNPASSSLSMVDLQSFRPSF